MASSIDDILGQYGRPEFDREGTVFGAPEHWGSQLRNFQAKQQPDPWTAAEGSPWKTPEPGPAAKAVGSALASKPAQMVMDWANFAGPAVGRIPRPVMAAEGAGGGGLAMDQAARLARARAMGFDTNKVVYHGSPDFRGIKAAQAFEPRTHSTYNIAAQEFEKVRQPVYLTPDRRMAATYADDHRAFDYQNAEPAIFSGYTRIENPLTINAMGSKFSELPISFVRKQIPPERQAAFDDLIKTYVGDRTRANIKTGDLEVIAQKLGHDGFIIDNVMDSYNGTGKPGQVRAVFDPKNIRSVDAAFDPAKSDSSNFLASRIVPAAAGSAAAAYAMSGDDAEAAETAPLLDDILAGRRGHADGGEVGRFASPDAYTPSSVRELNRSKLDTADKVFLGFLSLAERAGIGGTPLKIYNDVVSRKRTNPITERDFTESERKGLHDIVMRKYRTTGNPVGNIDYPDYRDSDVASATLGGFRYSVGDGNRVNITDNYDFNTNRGHSWDRNPIVRALAFPFNAYGNAAAIGRIVVPPGSGVPVSLSLDPHSPTEQPARTSSVDDILSGYGKP